MSPYYIILSLKGTAQTFGHSNTRCDLNQTLMHQISRIESPFKSEKLILSTTVTKENNPWRQVAKTGCKQFQLNIFTATGFGVVQWYAVALVLY
jgi:hypothetical protein